MADPLVLDRAALGRLLDVVEDIIVGAAVVVLILLAPVACERLAPVRPAIRCATPLVCATAWPKARAYLLAQGATITDARDMVSVYLPPLVVTLTWDPDALTLHAQSAGNPVEPVPPSVVEGLAQAVGLPVSDRP